MVGNTKQGWALFARDERAVPRRRLRLLQRRSRRATRHVAQLDVDDAPTPATQPGGNMEGKETRFGIADSALFATVTTDASCGAVNSMHDSFTPLGGLVPLVNIMTRRGDLRRRGRGPLRHADVRGASRSSSPA